MRALPYLAGVAATSDGPRVSLGTVLVMATGVAILIITIVLGAISLLDIIRELDDNMEGID